MHLFFSSPSENQKSLGLPNNKYLSLSENQYQSNTVQQQLEMVQDKHCLSALAVPPRFSTSRSLGSWLMPASTAACGAKEPVDTENNLASTPRTYCHGSFSWLSFNIVTYQIVVFHHWRAQRRWHKFYSISYTEEPQSFNPETKNTISISKLFQYNSKLLYKREGTLFTTVTLESQNLYFP